MRCCAIQSSLGVLLVHDYFSHGYQPPERSSPKPRGHMEKPERNPYTCRCRFGQDHPWWTQGQTKPQHQVGSLSYQVNGIFHHNLLLLRSKHFRLSLFRCPGLMFRPREASTVILWTFERRIMYTIPRSIHVLQESTGSHFFRIGLMVMWWPS